MEINFDGIFAWLSSIIAVFTKRLFQVKEWLDKYFPQEEESEEEEE